VPAEFNAADNLRKRSFSFWPAALGNKPVWAPENRSAQFYDSEKQIQRKAPSCGRQTKADIGAIMQLPLINPFSLAFRQTKPMPIGCVRLNTFSPLGVCYRVCHE
jgi:hypothetical protein